MRALRRHHYERMKKRALEKFGGYMKTMPDQARHAGIFANTSKSCSSWCCGNPRRWFDEPTVQERRAYSVEEELALLE